MPSHRAKPSSALGVPPRQQSAMRAKARRLDMTLQQYVSRLAGGEAHCPACNQWKPRGAFYKGKGYAGVQSRCIACSLEYQRRRRAQ